MSKPENETPHEEGNCEDAQPNSGKSALLSAAWGILFLTLAAFLFSFAYSYWATGSTHCDADSWVLPGLRNFFTNALAYAACDTFKEQVSEANRPVVGGAILALLGLLLVYIANRNFGAIRSKSPENNDEG